MQAKLRVCLLFVFLMGCATLFDTAAACDVGGILTCNQILGTSTQSLIEGVFPDAHTLMKTCSLLGNYTTCVDKTLIGCDSQIKLGINIVKDVVDFMCKDSYQAILDNSECWVKPDFKTDIDQCQITNKETVKSVNGQISTRGATWAYRQLCVAMHDVTNCMSSAAKTRCGAEPELIMHNMMNAALRRTYTLLRGCSAPILNRIGTTTIEPVTTSVVRGSKTTTINSGSSTTTIEPVTTSAVRGSKTTTITSGSSTTKYSYALYVTSIISCIVILAA